MPAVFREAGFRFYFFSNEGSPREPIHVHVSKDGVDAKVWLYPEVAFSYNHGFAARDQRLILAIATARRTEIEECWNGHFGSSG